MLKLTRVHIQIILMLASLAVMLNARFSDNTVLAYVSYSIFLLLTWQNMQMFISFKSKLFAVKILHIAFLLTAVAPVIMLYDAFYLNAVSLYLPALLMLIICLESKYQLNRDESIRAFIGGIMNTKFVLLAIAFLLFLMGAFLADAARQVIFHAMLLCGLISTLLIDGKVNSFFTSIQPIQPLDR